MQFTVKIKSVLMRRPVTHSYRSVGESEGVLSGASPISLGRSYMELAGWVAVAMGAVAGGVTFLGFLIDQIQALSKKVIPAIRSVRAVRDEIKRGGSK